MRCASHRAQARHPREPDRVLAFGEQRAAPSATWSASPNRGLEYMFIMMNGARSRSACKGSRSPSAPTSSAPICAQARPGQPPVAAACRPPCPSSSIPTCERMLLSMKRRRRGDARAGALRRAAARSRRRIATMRGARAHQARVELLIPSSRAGAPRSASRSPRSACRCMAAWASSRRPAPRSTLRDARIITIYEGTTGIQANDLLGRKIVRDGGAAMAALLKDMDKGRSFSVPRPAMPPRGRPASRRWKRWACSRRRPIHRSAA